MTTSQETEHKALRRPTRRASFRTGAPRLSGSAAARWGGTELVAGSGDLTSLPSGHDAWVVGDEPVVVVDWYGATNYAKGG